MNRELRATFTRENVAFQNDDGTRVVIATAELADGTEMVLKGEAAEGALKRGLLYRFYGREVEHHKYGRQFAFTGFVEERPAGKRAVVIYLQQCKGIGTVVAKRLWEEYGEMAVVVLRTQPKHVARMVSGLTEETALAAAEFLQRRQHTERAKMDVMELLHGRGFPRKLTEQLLRDFGSAAADRVRHNPYLLLRYRGCGFLSCDRFYLDLELPPGRLKRQALAAWNEIYRDSGGDSWFPANRLRRALESSIAATEVRTDDAIRLVTRAKLLRERKDSTGTTWFAEDRKARDEQRVARIVAGVMEEERGLTWPSIQVQRLDVSEHQREKIGAALARHWGVLAGRPGTGKTFSTAAIIKSLLEHWKPSDIAVAAPTGKAAVRITESMQALGVNIQATTVHSLLKVQSVEGGGWSFQHGERLPLPHQFVFLDEASMLSVDLAASFFSAIGPHTHLLLVGDTHQLAPVGHGAPLRDLIEAGVPCGELTEIRRNSGRIVQTCSEIVDSRRFTPSPTFNLDEGENLKHVQCGNAEQQIEVLEQFISRMQESGEHDATWDCQILVAVNRKSPLARKTLNKRVQQLLNPSGDAAKGNPFRVRDKIICVQNGWFPSVQPDVDPVNADGKVYVANGEQGEVLQVEPNKTIVRLAAPARTILVPRGTQNDDERDGQDGEDEGAEKQKTDTGCSWDLGYACSTHKSQGSEWPIVIILADEYPGARMVQSRQWLYTALSRAKKFCLTIGKRTVIEDMLRRDGLRRKTFLVEQIDEERERIRRVRAAEAVQHWDDQVWEGILEGVG